MSSHRTLPDASKVAYLGVWAVFAAVSLRMDGWADVGPLLQFIGGLAFVGVLIAALWTFGNVRWGYAALATSLLLLAAYLLWWIVDIGDRYSVDPTPGLWRTITAQLEIWLAMTRAFIGRSHYLDGICQLYWGVLMPLLQLALLPSLLRSLKSSRRLGAGILAA